MERSLEVQVHSGDTILAQPGIDFRGYSAHVSDADFVRLKLTVKFSPTEFAEFMHLMRRIEARLADAK